MDRPQRRWLPHEVPLWIDPSKEIYFLTICCAVRGKNLLAREPLASSLFETVAFRNQSRIWFAHLFLLMPDHAHALITFPSTHQPPLSSSSGRDGPPGRPPPSRPRTMVQIISQWKEWTAKRLKIPWQHGFFEHRLRKEESYHEKSHYILQNPVRAGLVQKPEDWPFVYFAQQNR
jgi:REP element-mobilizing transposase RayT